MASCVHAPQNYASVSSLHLFFTRRVFLRPRARVCSPARDPSHQSATEAVGNIYLVTDWTGQMFPMDESEGHPHARTDGGTDGGRAILHQPTGKNHVSLTDWKRNSFAFFPSPPLMQPALRAVIERRRTRCNAACVSNTTAAQE